MSGGAGGRLAERYGRLLEAYPERYRTQRGEEILGTLLDSARPGQRWPSAREAAALLAGGLRTRLAHHSPSYRAWWYGVVHLVVLLLLLPKVYALVTSVLGNYHGYEYRYGLLAVSPVAVAVWAVFGVAGLGAVLMRWYRVALAAVAMLAVLELVVLGRVAPASGTGLMVSLALNGLLLALLAVLAVRPPARALRPPRAWTAVLLAVALMSPPYVPVVSNLAGRWDILFGLGILASLLLGLFDLRVPAAAALYLLGSGAFTVAVDALAVDGPAVGVAWNIVATLVSALLLAGASLLGQRMVVRL
jgi:hypothetical protein